VNCGDALDKIKMIGLLPTRHEEVNTLDPTSASQAEQIRAVRMNDK
jgi:hypothetical protein